MSIFRQFWDTQNAAPGLTSGPHCTDDGGMINGFPITCPRQEGQEAVGTDFELETTMNQYQVLALVNRLDLAHEGWRNCGEYRIVYGKQGTGIAKNLIIFEAVLPNPRPGCREGCVPIAEFWKNLSTIDNPVVRATELEKFYYAGLTGFPRPVVHVDHYSASGVGTTYGSSGSGQIRTNQFLQIPWTLKEFKTLIDCGVTPCQFGIVPISVKVNPPGSLWNEDNADPRAIDFRSDTLSQTSTLASMFLMGIGYGVDLANNAGQSVSQGSADNYRIHMNAALATSFRTSLATGGLTADQMANRALAQSCAGCHNPANFGLTLPDSIGTVMTPIGSPVFMVDSWPGAASANFVHVDVPATPQSEFTANPIAFPSPVGHEISPALKDFFLPARKNFLLAQLNAARCTCVPRFAFLPIAKQRLALQIEARVESRFTERVRSLEEKILQAQAMASGEKTFSTLEKERSNLLAERDKELFAELSRNGITLPESEFQNLKPQFMKLKAGALAKGDAAAAWRLRAKEINGMLLDEPARRTVTGSYRVH